MAKNRNQSPYDPGEDLADLTPTTVKKKTVELKHVTTLKLNTAEETETIRQGSLYKLEKLRDSFDDKEEWINIIIVK